MRIFSWNVNGLRAVIANGTFDAFLEECKPDVLCLQETKINEGTLERAGIREKYADYEQVYSFAEKKGYSGTSVWVKRGIFNGNGPSFSKYEKTVVQTSETDSIYAFSDKYGDVLNEGRVAGVDMGEFYLLSVYVPNTKDDLSRLPLRKKWDKALANFVKSLDKPAIICGDFNVANEEIDLARPKDNVGKHGFTDEERAGFKALLANTELRDVFREENPELRDAYTWWTHWGKARERNVGWRIDYFLVSKKLLRPSATLQVKKAEIWTKILGSDHCPISLTLETN